MAMVDVDTSCLQVDSPPTASKAQVGWLGPRSGIIFIITNIKKRHHLINTKQKSVIGLLFAMSVDSLYKRVLID